MRKEIEKLIEQHAELKKNNKMATQNNVAAQRLSANAVNLFRNNKN